jgi:AsmA protein
MARLNWRFSPAWAQLKTTLTFDLDKQQYQLADMDLQVNGAALDVTNLKLKASGDASANLASQEFGASKFKLDASGVKGTDNFDATLDAPALSMTRDKFSAEKLAFNGKLDGAMGNVVAALAIPGLEGNAQAFKVSALTLDLDVKQAEQTFKVKLASPLSGNFAAKQFNLSALTLGVNATGDKLPNKSVSSELKGSVQLDLTRQSEQANLAGGLLQSQLKANVGVSGFSNPFIQFNVELDQLDADLYLPKKTGAKDNTPEKPLDLSALRTLNLSGSLRIGQLKVANIKSSAVRLDVKAHNVLVNISPLSANLYQGSMNGSLSVNAAAMPAIPSMKISMASMSPR